MSEQRVAAARSFLFVPGNRPDRFDKALTTGADVVVIDLEDAVAPADKNDARLHAAAWLRQGNQAMVRVNATGTPWYEDDLRLIASSDADVMVAKAADASELARIASLRQGLALVPLVETAAAIVEVGAISAAAGVVRCAFGSIDLATELGVDPNDRDAMLFARASLVMASAAAATAMPIDGVTTAIRDRDALVSDLTYAKRVGMTAKLCIHPAQIEAVHAVLAPTVAELAWARRVVDAARPTGSVTTVDGHMIDAPIIERARRILMVAEQR